MLDTKTTTTTPTAATGNLPYRPRRRRGRLRPRYRRRNRQGSRSGQPAFPARLPAVGRRRSAMPLWGWSLEILLHLPHVAAADLIHHHAEDREHARATLHRALASHHSLTTAAGLAPIFRAPSVAHASPPPAPPQQPPSSAAQRPAVHQTKPAPRSAHPRSAGLSVEPARFSLVPPPLPPCEQTFVAPGERAQRGGKKLSDAVPRDRARECTSPPLSCPVLRCHLTSKNRELSSPCLPWVTPGTY